MTDKLPDRLTLVSTLYHQSFGSPAVSVDSRFTRALRSGEQLWKRDFRIGDSWTALETGWVGSRPAHLLLLNHEGQHLQVNPTEEEKADIAKRIIEVTWSGSGSPQWLVFPGESMRGECCDPSQVFVRSRHGSVQVTLYLIPE